MLLAVSSLELRVSESRRLGLERSGVTSFAEFVDPKGVERPLLAVLLDIVRDCRMTS